MENKIIKNEIDWVANEPRFFELNPGSKTPKRRGWSTGESRIDVDKLELVEAVGMVPPQGFLIVDADDAEAVANVEKAIAIRKVEPVSYNTTRGKHYVFRTPQGAYFDKLSSQTDASVFDKPDGRTNIDIKAGGRLGKNGYFKIKDGAWRITPQEIMEAFEKAPEAPISLLVGKKEKVKLSEYIGGARDELVYKEWLTRLRAASYDKKSFLTLMLEVKYLANDTEGAQETIDWATEKWNSSENAGNPVNFGMNNEIFADAVSKILEAIPEKVESVKEEVVEEEIVEETKEEKKTRVVKEKKSKDKADEGFKKHLPAWQQRGLAFKNIKTIPMVHDILDFKVIAKEIIDKTNLQYSSEDNQIWGVELNSFKPIDDIDIFLKRWMIYNTGNIKPKVINELKSYMLGAIPIKLFEKNEYLISFQDGTNYNVLKNEMVEMDEHRMNQNVIPHKFITDEEIKTTHRKEAKFLEKTMSGWASDSPDLVKQIYEKVGLAMTKDTRQEIAAFFLGSGSNGKSMFFELLIKALGDINVSHEDLKELSQDQFSSSNLYGKLANINTDISADVIEDPSLFKKIVSGDRISASFKGKNKFSFSPYSLLMFGANNIPYTREHGDSDAITRRIEILPFTRIYDKKKFSEVEQNEFRSMIFSEKVVEVFIRKGLDALNEAYKNGFTISEISKLKKEEIMKEMNHLLDFIEEKGIIDGEVIVKAHRRYVDWAKEYGYTTYKLREFSKKYENAARAMGIDIVKDTRAGNNSSRHTFIVNSTGGE